MKKTAHEEEEHDEGDEIWLMSYSDLMTLLFGFFVLMYVFASSKTGDAEKVREGLAKSFGGTYVPPYDELADQLKQQADDVESHPVLQHIDVQTPKDGMEITFRSNLLFKSGSAELLPPVKKTLSLIAGLISKSVDDAEVLVGGHTDDVPIKTKIFPSNWELSVSRSASVVREFIASGYDPKMLVAVGYAETRPAYPNKTKDGKAILENRQKNRRVVIKVVAPGVVKQPTASAAAGIGEGRTVLTGDGSPGDSPVKSKPAAATKPAAQQPAASKSLEEKIAPIMPPPPPKASDR